MKNIIFTFKRCKLTNRLYLTHAYHFICQKIKRFINWGENFINRVLLFHTKLCVMNLDFVSNFHDTFVLI